MDSNALQKLITDAHSDILLDDAKYIIDVTREYAYRAINVAMVQRKRKRSMARIGLSTARRSSKSCRSS